MKDLITTEIYAYAEAHSVPESEVCRRLREETYRSVDCPQTVSYTHLTLPTILLV